VTAGGGHRVRLLPGGEETVVEDGTLLILACRKAGVKVPNLCGNRGLCTTCSAEIRHGGDSLSGVESQERQMLAWIGAPSRVRLACQAQVHGDVEVHAGISPLERLDYDPSAYPWASTDENEVDGD